MGQTVEIKKPRRLRGLGDNISSAGLIHHHLVKYYPDYQDFEHLTEENHTDM